MELIDVVEKLIGPTRPLGESTRDAERFKNLQALCILTTKLILEIHAIAADHKDSHEHSRMKSGKLAAGVLEEIKEYL